MIEGSRAAFDGGFAEPVEAAQSTFNAVMNAMARPGRIHALEAVAAPPVPLSAETGALLLTLADADTAVWLDSGLAAHDDAAAWIGFHTGARMTETAGEADFAVIGEPAVMPAFETFSVGTDQYPDRSTTLILQVDSLTGGSSLRLTGPGIRDVEAAAPRPMHGDFAARWAVNRGLYPRGVDLILVAPGQVMGLPRSTTMSSGEG